MFFVVGIYISILKLSLVGFWYTSTLDLHMDLFKPFAADKWIIKDFYFIFWNETFHNPNFLNHFLSALILRKALCPSGTWKQHGQLLGSCTEPVLWYQTMLHSLTESHLVNLNEWYSTSNVDNMERLSNRAVLQANDGTVCVFACLYLSFRMNRAPSWTRTVEAKTAKTSNLSNLNRKQEREKISMNLQIWSKKR